MQSQNLEKIVVATGVGKLRQRADFVTNLLPVITKDLTAITGQKPSERPARKSVAGFKIRGGDVVGLKVTMRGKRMNDFLKRLIEVVLPRIKDFHGIDPKNIDRDGNLSIGIKEHIVFPEVNPDEVKFDFGLEVTLVPSKRGKGDAYDFFKSLGIPLQGK